MQQFTLIHDGSDQAWQTAYLAFHIANQLGAPLLAFLFDPNKDNLTLTQRAAQIEVGGRAAGVVIETQILSDYSLEAVTAYSKESNGIFIPHRLLPDELTTSHYLEILSKPLWIVSGGSEVHNAAVLVTDFRADEQLINDTITLAQRTELSLTRVIREKEPATTAISWISVADFSPEQITAALNQHQISLLFVPASAISLVADLSINCVVYPFGENA
jgi:hypothetical protein